MRGVFVGGAHRGRLKVVLVVVIVAVGLVVAVGCINACA